jgi:hypothetical protein
MQQAAEAFPIRAPTQIRLGIDDPFGGLAKNIRSAERQNAPDHVLQSDLVTGQRRFTMSAPDLLIGIGVQGAAHFGEARTGIGAILIRDVLRPKMVSAHGKRSCSNRPISAYQIDCLVAFKSLRSDCR